MGSFTFSRKDRNAIRMLELIIYETRNGRVTGCISTAHECFSPCHSCEQCRGA